MKFLHSLVLFAWTLLGCSVSSAADEKLSLPEVIEQATVDMPLATSPASFVLGASGENVPRLVSFRAFATQAARAYDAKGNVANAVGVELAPALAMGRMTWSDIVNSQPNRIWSRTTVSFATKAKSGTSPSQSAVGLQSILWAPAMDAALTAAKGDQCTTIARKPNETPPASEPGPPPPLLPEQLKNIEACQNLIDAQLTKWNQPMVAVGGARAFTSSGDASSPKKDTTAFWITAAYGADIGSKKSEPDPVSRSGYLLTAHFRQTTNVSTVSLAGADAPARQQLFGVNGRYGTARLAGIAEYSLAKSRAAAADFADRKRALLGLEYKVDKDLYLTVGVARDTGAEVSKRSVLANINWGFSKQPVLLPK